MIANHIIWEVAIMNCETYYLNLLYGRGNFHRNINSYIKLNDGSGYRKVILLCDANPTYKKAFGYNDMFAQHFCGGLMKTLSLEGLSMDKLITLSTHMLLTSKQRLNDFLNLKNQFEQYILTKSYDFAKKTLISVYQEFGMSLWLLDGVSILKNLNSNDKQAFLISFNELEKSYYDLFNLKNNIKERHNYYIKKMNEMINCEKLTEEQVDFLQYFLFVSTPKSEINWLNVIKNTYYFSFIDMYLVVKQYLLHADLSENRFNKDCFDYILQINDIEGSTYSINENKAIEDAEKIMALFNDDQFESVITSFFSVESNFYNYFGAYKLVALSSLFLNEKISNSKVLSVYIIYLMCLILSRDETSTIAAINKLLSIARLLRSFQIQKGLCLFIQCLTGYDFGVSLREHIQTKVDYVFFDKEYESENLLFLPYKSQLYKVSDEQISKYIDCFEEFVETFPSARFYFKEAYIRYKIDLFVANLDFVQATKMFVLAYAENKLLAYVLNTTEIVKSISDKIKNGESLLLEELCYIFIDNSVFFVEERRNCFLNYFDSSDVEEPLDLINEETKTDPIVLFFLYNVCNKEMLLNLYRKFKSTEAVENYRLKICEFLLEIDGYINKKDLMAEAEKISKSRALSKKMKEVDKSRVTINTDFIKSNCFDEIDDEVAAYNVTGSESFFVTDIIDGIPVFAFTNIHNTILNNMYNVYAKEFCFGNHSIDLSLSTRVRHGAFSNQILKAFTDNNLTFNGHGKNEFINKLIEKNAIDADVCKVFLKFSDKIEKLLDYFTQHTLKVVLDKPIKDAVFRYDLDDCDLFPIYDEFRNVEYVTFDDVASVLNDFLLQKTNEYLTKIKNEELPTLLQNIISEIDSLSVEIKEFILDQEESRFIERSLINCKTDVQKSFELVAEWFSLSEYNDWENYDFKELIETCQEISKSLFSDFDNLTVNNQIADSCVFRGKTFRDMVDIVLIIFNNAVLHSGYKEHLQALGINVELTEDSSALYMSFVNNLSDEVDINELDHKIAAINKSFGDKSYLKINTRQEGGMGLYKIMHTLFSVLKLGNGFYVSRYESNFRVEIKIQKEILFNEKDIDS